MNRFLTYAVLFLWLALTFACARLPEYAQPRIVQAHEQRETLVAGFPYRPLTQDDFRAASVSEQLKEHAERINAHSTIRIRVTADSSFRITSGDFNGQSYFFGSIVHLAFEAVMLPDRSWWNPNIPANRRDYVLQHEQIHFALTELAARQLTSDTHQWASDVLVIELTPQAVLVELSRQINDRINAAMQASLKRQAKFDEDTSMSYNPKWQNWWSWTVEEELKKSHRN
ncbi:MAG TPA: hypothetical protein VMB77_01515 [Syntrophales bacterium]|nr:hypothetical protein [Syntrophales bacterium]